MPRCININDQDMGFIIYLCLINLKNLTADLINSKIHTGNILIAAFVDEYVFAATGILRHCHF